MTDTSFPSAHGYYFAPLTTNGKYENALSQFGDDAGHFLVAAVALNLGGTNDPASATNTGFGILGNIVGSIGSTTFGEAGHVIDNIPNIIQNINTALQQLNDSVTWMTPDLGE